MDEREILIGSEKRRLSNAKQLGPADADEIVEVTVLLKFPKGKSAGDLTAHINAAPRCGQHLTREAYEQQFASPVEDLIRVERFAHLAGLDVLEASPERRSVVLSGTLAAMSRAFGTQLWKYRHPNGSTFRGRSGPILIPSDLSDVIDAVLGLDDRPVGRPHLRRGTSRSDPPVANGTGPHSRPGPGSWPVPDQGLQPASPSFPAWTRAVRPSANSTRRPPPRPPDPSGWAHTRAPRAGGPFRRPAVDHAHGARWKRKDAPRARAR